MRFMSHYFGFCFATLKLDYTCLRLLYLNCFYIALADYLPFSPESTRGNREPMSRIKAWWYCMY